jgi:hypothetical protein
LRKIELCAAALMAGWHLARIVLVVCVKGTRSQ